MQSMNSAFKTYYQGTSFLHALDARVKIVALVLATAALFCVHTLPSMLMCFCVLFLLVVLSRVPAAAWVPFLPPACIFALLPVLFNGFAFDVYAAQESLMSYYGVSPENIAVLQPVVLWGGFGIVPAGCLYGATLGLRIFILMYASLLFTFTTQARAVVAAITWFLAPLMRVGVPVRAISLVFSLALCFIPVIAQELAVVANAQRCRGASLDSGTLPARIKAWSQVFLPLFVRLFRHAETLGLAMDARCYGVVTNDPTLCQQFRQKSSSKSK